MNDNINLVSIMAYMERVVVIRYKRGGGVIIDYEHYRNAILLIVA